MKRRQLMLILETIGLGMVGALAARLFTFLLAWTQHLLLEGVTGYASPSLDEQGQVVGGHIGTHWLWLVPLATTLGGLISGVLVYALAPEAEGHGTDAAVKAFHRSGGYIRARVAPLKMIASAITIGSGGSAGREGPTALISAGIASVYASWTRRPDNERRLLVLIGMAAGLSAIFRSPLGTAVFAIEVLYGLMEFEVGALLYTMLGAVVAYAVNGWFTGWEPLFNISQNIRGPAFADYLWYLALGVASGLVATVLPELFYRVRDLFRVIPIPAHFKPALGGLGVGLIALWLPQVLGGGYGWIEMAINGQLAAGVMLTLVLAKMVAFALTVSSGGSGGVFAPSLFVGAMLGSALAQVFGQPAAPFAILGMAAVFGGAARVPLATILMVSEMTGGYEFLAPAALAVTVSYMAQVAFSSRLRYGSLYEAQVVGRWDSPAHHAEHLRAVQQMLREQRIDLPPDARHIDLQTLLASGLAVDLPEDRRLLLGTVRDGGPLAGRPIAALEAEAEKADAVVACVLRDERALPAAGIGNLEAADRVLLITAEQVPEALLRGLEIGGR